MITAYETAEVARALSQAGLPRELVTWCRRHQESGQSYRVADSQTQENRDVELTSPSGRILGYAIERPMGDWIAAYRPLQPIRGNGLPLYARFVNYSSSVHPSMAEAIVSVIAKAVAGL